ncbi:MAG: helix-turn-helix domain-containing protein [Ekhidna sp.]
MVKELLSYINHHLDGDISLERLSKLSGYSPFYLHRKFKSKIGYSIRNFIIHQRIETAAYMLTLTTIPIAQIKHLVGYETASSFNKAFKKVMGVSPKSFRTSNNYLEAVHHVPKSEYLSLNYELIKLPPRNAIVFPSVGNYFHREIYQVWGEVDRYLQVNELSEDQFEYLAILHSCQNITPDLPGRYDAVIVPKPGTKLEANRFFQTQVPGGKFIKYRFCANAADFQRLTLVIGKHMESQGIVHGQGISYLAFHTLPNPGNPDNLLTDWYMPIE